MSDKKYIDDIVQKFIQLCTIEQHLAYDRRETFDGDRITYYPLIENQFIVDDLHRSSECSKFATEFLLNNLLF